MAWMASWLQQLILMILLATFAEMLLPKNTLQRYVKSVLGLFILLTMLSPIFTLLQKQKDISQMLASAAATDGGIGYTGAAMPAGARPSGSSLAAILEEGERLKAANAEQSQAMVESSILSLLNEHALVGASHRAVRVEVDLAENNGEAQIRHMRVLLHAIDNQQEAKRPLRENWKFEPIAPVDVRIAPETKERNEAGAPAIDGEALATDSQTEEKKTSGRIMGLLKEKLQLNEGQVTLSFGKNAET
jgi:stage III sporulation protein AF